MEQRIGKNNSEFDYMKIIAQNPDLNLDVEDIQKIEEYRNMLDINDSNSITQFGADLQKDMAELSQMMINNLNRSEVDQIDDILEQTVTYLVGIDENETGKRRWFWQKRAKEIPLRQKYETASKNVDAISNSLEQHQARLLKDCAILDQIYTLNREYYKQINLRIAAIRKLMEEIQTGELQTQEDNNDDMPTGVADDMWETNVITRLERKIVDLELSRTVSLQQVPQIHMLQANSSVMAEKIQSTLYNTIPLWKNQIVLALSADHAKQAISANRQITDMTNRLIVKNAENLKMVTAETQRASADNFVDPNALAKTNRILIESLNEVAKIQQENSSKRVLVESELERLDREMRYGITSEPTP